MNSKEKAQTIDLHKTGLHTQQEIANRLGLSLSQVSRVLRKVIKKEKRIKLVKLRYYYFDCGMTQEEIAEKIGCSQSHVNYMLNDSRFRKGL